MIDNVAGIILAGGKSTRMGKDKALLKIDGKTIIEHITIKLKAFFREVIVVANDVKKFDFLGLPVIRDIIPSKGPLGGIYTGLVKSNTPYSFILSCDTPFLKERVIEYISRYSDGYDVVVPEYKGRFEPLFAVYSKNCIGPIENQLRQNNLKVTDLFQFVKIRVITEQEITRVDPEARCFININTIKDYERYKYSKVS